MKNLLHDWRPHLDSSEVEQLEDIDFEIRRKKMQLAEWQEKRDALRRKAVQRARYARSQGRT